MNLTIKLVSVQRNLYVETDINKLSNKETELLEYRKAKLATT